MFNKIVLLNEVIKIADKFNKDKFTYIHDEKNKFLLKFLIIGLENTPYQNGQFQINISLPKNYPNEAPKVNFTTKIWHPNICVKTGLLRHQILKKQWKPSFSIAYLIEFILKLIAYPDIDDVESANPIAKMEYIENPKIYKIKGQDFTYEFANLNLIKKNKLTLPRSELEDSINSENSEFYKSMKKEENSIFEIKSINKNFIEKENNWSSRSEIASNEDNIYNRNVKLKIVNTDNLINSLTIANTESNRSHRNEILDKEENEKVPLGKIDKKCFTQKHILNSLKNNPNEFVIFYDLNESNYKNSQLERNPVRADVTDLNLKNLFMNNDMKDK